MHVRGCLDGAAGVLDDVLLVVQLVLGESGVVLHDLLHLIVLLNRDVQWLLDDEPVDLLRAWRGGEGSLVVVHC